MKSKSSEGDCSSSTSTQDSWQGDPEACDPVEDSCNDGLAVTTLPVSDEDERFNLNLPQVQEMDTNALSVPAKPSKRKSFLSGAPISRSNFPLSRRVSSFSWLHLPRSSFFSGSKIRKEERVSLLSLQLQSEVQYTRCGFSISLSLSLVIASSSLLSMRMHKKKKRGSSLLSSSS